MIQDIINIARYTHMNISCIRCLWFVGREGGALDTRPRLDLPTPTTGHPRSTQSWILFPGLLILTHEAHTYTPYNTQNLPAYQLLPATAYTEPAHSSPFTICFLIKFPRARHLILLIFIIIISYKLFFFFFSLF